MATRKTLSELTSNEYYGGLNRRFVTRIRRLRSVGFVYNRENHSWYYKNRQKNGLHGCFIMNAGHREWVDHLRRII